MDLAGLAQMEPGADACQATLPVQIQSVAQRQTQSGKPFFDLQVADGSAQSKLKIWSDTPAFSFLQNQSTGTCCALTAEFFVNDYGLNVTHPALELLEADALEEFLAGSPQRRELIDSLWQEMIHHFESLEDPRLRALTTTCLTDLEARWKRAAAARSYHHARRGGLLEHTCQMLRSARALAPLYPEIYPDLLFAGVLFHDLGKCWENDFPDHGFISRPSRMGELLGHITIGVEVVNRYWHQIQQDSPELFEDTVGFPPAERVREHLLHLIVSHHGQLEFGSPVTPKIPEAWMLHAIDNLDARLEMMRGSYVGSPVEGTDLFKAQRPLSGYLARCLTDFNSPGRGD